jgi:transcriptional regulator with XRE-family HTH domain
MNPETLAAWGRKVRERRGVLTQEQLGRLCGTDQSTISRIERGQLAISDEMKWKLAGALATTVDDLFPYPNVRPPFPKQTEQAPA